MDPLGMKFLIWWIQRFLLAPLGRSQLFVGPQIFLWELLAFPYESSYVLLLMEEILHHLGCINPCK